MVSKNKRQNVEIHSKEQYYVKRGKKYIKVNDPGAYDGLGDGTWMIVVNKGCTSIRTVVNPKLIELDASLKYLEDGLCEAISSASVVRSRTSPNNMSEKEKRAWKEFGRIMGDDMPTHFEHASNCEIAQKGCEYIRKIMLKHNCDPKKIAEEYDIKAKRYINPILDLETNEN